MNTVSKDIKDIKDLKFSKSHEWVKLERNSNSNIITVGISSHAQNLLGDLVYVELPELGREYSSGEECCVVESVKAASDVYCPVSGVVISVNKELDIAPEQVNNEPYDSGWLFKLEVTNMDELNSLISAEEYVSMVTNETEV